MFECQPSTLPETFLVLAGAYLGKKKIAELGQEKSQHQLSGGAPLPAPRCGGSIPMLGCAVTASNLFICWMQQVHPGVLIFLRKFTSLEEWSRENFDLLL
jgi:hypothetical protein